MGVEARKEANGSGFVAVLERGRDAGHDAEGQKAERGQTTALNRARTDLRRRERLSGGEESCRLRRQIEDGPDALDACDGLRRGAEAQFEFTPETVHTPGDVNQV